MVNEAMLCLEIGIYLTNDIKTRYDISFKYILGFSNSSKM